MALLIPGVGLVEVTGTLLIPGGGIVHQSATTSFVKRYPNAVLALSFLSGSYTDIDEDPSSPDANWLAFDPAA